MTTPPRNNLERSLMRAAEDPAHRPQFYRDLVESDFFIVQQGPPPEQSRRTVLQKGQQLEIQDIELNGKFYLPVYSSLPRLQASLREEAAYIALNAMDFMELTQGAEIVLDPGSPFSKEFTTEEIRSIIDGSIWEASESYTVEKETEILIGQPESYPHDLADALSRLFEKTKEVKQAYLSHFFNPEKDEKPHTLIGVQVSGNWDKVSSQAGLVARSVEIPDPPVDFIQITGRGGIEDYFLKESKPFYKKKFLGVF